MILGGASVPLHGSARLHLSVVSSLDGVAHVVIRLCAGRWRGEGLCLCSYWGLAPLLHGWSELLLEVSPSVPPNSRACALEWSPLMVVVSWDNLEGVAWRCEAELLACCSRRHETVALPHAAARCSSGPVCQRCPLDGR